jgi:hypothetical protein
MSVPGPINNARPNRSAVQASSVRVPISNAKRSNSSVGRSKNGIQMTSVRAPISNAKRSNNSSAVLRKSVVGTTCVRGLPELSHHRAARAVTKHGAVAATATTKTAIAAGKLATEHSFGSVFGER